MNYESTSHVALSREAIRSTWSNETHKQRRDQAQTKLWELVQLITAAELCCQEDDLTMTSQEPVAA